MEILGNNLMERLQPSFWDKETAVLTYCGNNYEVWDVPKELLAQWWDKKEWDFDDCWWRWASGSSLNFPSGDAKVVVNGKEMVRFDTYLNMRNEYACLTDYLCSSLGASNETNVCACSVDLAAANHMTLGEFWTVYEGDNV